MEFTTGYDVDLSQGTWAFMQQRSPNLDDEVGGYSRDVSLRRTISQ